MENEVEKQESRLTTRGDSFDIGNNPQSQALTKDPAITNILQDPNALAQLLNINEEQAENIKSVIVGAGAGAAYKYLGKYFGGEIAAMFGAFASSLIARKVIGK